MSSKLMSSVGPETMRVALEAAQQAMFEFDPETGHVVWADVAQADRVIGVEPSEQKSAYTALMERLPADQAEARLAAIGRAKDEAENYRVEFRANRKDTGEEPLWFEERGTWVKVGGKDRLVGMLRRIDAQKQREEKLSYLAGHDEMTGHLNRARTKEVLNAAIARAGEGDGSAFFLIGVDAAH
ncbi:MAG: hypothetical protein AAGG79_04050, partial [Pseudomonadota bacterium]